MLRASPPLFCADCYLSFSSSATGSLHVGDEILEINGTNVTDHSVDQLQKAMVRILTSRRGSRPHFSVSVYTSLQGLLPLLILTVCEK